MHRPDSTTGTERIEMRNSSASATERNKPEHRSVDVVHSIVYVCNPCAVYPSHKYTTNIHYPSTIDDSRQNTYASLRLVAHFFHIAVL